jgi:hypothetical protein
LLSTAVSAQCASLLKDDARIGEDDTRPTRVLDREASPSVLAGDTTDGATEVITVQRLNVLDLRDAQDLCTSVAMSVVHLERLDIELVHPQEGERVLGREAERIRRDKIASLLKDGVRRRGRMGRRL